MHKIFQDFIDGKYMLKVDRGNPRFYAENAQKYFSKRSSKNLNDGKFNGKFE